ncbi:hypothetical protein CSB69_3789 [Morganella morganii]|nr:hypothetical protein CSB69_3789 [Morganella morganii]
MFRQTDDQRVNVTAVSVITRRTQKKKRKQISWCDTSHDFSGFP